MNKSILNKNNLNLPTIIGTAIAIIPSAIAAEGSGLMTDAFGYLADFIDVGVSDFVHCLVYNLVFPFIYGYINRVNYTDGNSFNYSKLLSDITFKIVPVGWTVSVLLFHVPRNILMYQLVSSPIGFELWESSVIADVVTTIFFIPIRNISLKYYELIFDSTIYKIKQIKNKQ